MPIVQHILVPTAISRISVMVFTLRQEMPKETRGLKYFLRSDDLYSGPRPLYGTPFSYL